MSMLRSTFMGFEIAKRGLATSQKGLDITGHNMTNWDSAGYTRQRVDQVAVSIYSQTQRYSSSRIGQLGQGVGITGIGQIRDTFLDKRFRDEQAGTSYFDAARTILSDIEAAIGEFNPLTNAGVRGCLETLIPALKAFHEKPDSETAANIIQTEFKNLTQTLQQLDTNLTKVAEQYKFDLKTSTNELNEKLQRLAGLNYAIEQNKGISMQNAKYGPNELLDERNLLLDEIAQYGEIDVQVHEDYTVTVYMAGQKVVEGDKAEKIEYVDNGDNTVALRWMSTGEVCNFSSGLLKAHTDFINGRGPNITSKNETTYKGILYYRDQLDTFASALTSVVNNIVPDTLDADGNPLTYKNLLGALSSTPDVDGKYPVDPNGKVTAANFSLSDEWIEDSAYIIAYPKNKENKYILDLYTAIHSKSTTFSNRGQTFTGTFYEYVDSYAAVLSEDYVFYNGRYEASATNLTDLQDRRDAVSGVMMDEEVANMMLYNKSYQAASRLMTTLDEALDVLINKTGLVGR